MSIYNEVNLTSGLDDAFISTATEVPLFPIMILFFVFFIIVGGGYANQKKRLGYGDLPMWAALGSLSIFMLSLIFTFTTGMIDLVTLGIVVAFTIMCAVWFFLSRGRGEV